MSTRRNLPKWLYEHFAAYFEPAQLAVLDREWFTYSQISFSNSSISELDAEARAILAIEVGA